jgi:hypothetical protein
MLWAHLLAYVTGTIKNSCCETNIWRRRTGLSEVSLANWYGGKVSSQSNIVTYG